MYIIQVIRCTNLSFLFMLNCLRTNSSSFNQITNQLELVFCEKVSCTKVALLSEYANVCQLADIICLLRVHCRQGKITCLYNCVWHIIYVQM